MHKHIHHTNILPQDLLNAAKRIFPQATFSAEMLEIDTTVQLHENNSGLTYWLTENEQQLLNKYTLPKRRNEWLAGRLCAKIASACWFGTSQPVRYNTVEIANQESGRPYLKLTEEDTAQPLPDISISHSGEYAGALCASGYCGIDIQEPNKTLQRVLEKYCHNSESALLENLDSLETLQRLNVLWTAKEAIRKAMSHKSLPGFLEITLEDVVPISGPTTFSLQFTLGIETIEVVATIYQNYAISICLVEKD